MVERERASSHSCPLTSAHMHRQKGVRREEGGEKEKGKGREIISAVLQNKPSSGGNTEALCLFII